MSFLASDMTAWCSEHMGNPSSPEFRLYLDTFQRLLREKHVEMLAEHDNKGRFGMSGVGGCTRKGTFKVHPDYERVSFDGDTMMTFHIGHLMEITAISILTAMGYRITDMQKEVEIPPYMLSYIDGIIDMFDVKYLLSVKSTGYKSSSISATGKIFRAGFAALPYHGIYHSQTSWWAQVQAELHATGMEQAIILVVAKDMVKSFERDIEMRRNGSLSFYGEVVRKNHKFIEQMEEAWGLAWSHAERKEICPPYVFVKDTGEYLRLPAPGHIGEGWGGPNRKVTKTFNPCYGCEWQPNCLEV